MQCCGCGEATIALDKDEAGRAAARARRATMSTTTIIPMITTIHHDHDHDHDHHRHDDDGVVDYGAGLAGVHVPGLSQERIVRIERDILSKNDAYARDNRRAFAARGVFALNVVSSPGSGKTTLLVKTIEALKDRMAVA